MRATNRLSAIRVSKIKEPGLYEDGGGLRLVVTDKRVKRWALRITVRGHRVERGLGVWPTVSLEEARRAIEILSEARTLHAGGLIFPGIKGQALSDNVLSKLMREWGTPGTPHGFRSLFCCRRADLHRRSGYL